jgi:fumarate reductase flavoprotein subunit
MLVVTLLSGCTSNATTTSNTKALYKVGTYTAEATGNNGPIKVEVTMSDNAILGVKILNHKETVGLGDVALDRISKEIVEKQSLAVDTISGATNASKALLAAVEDCVSQAGGDITALKVALAKAGEGKIEKLTTDVVVIGAGGAGSAAAVTAAEAGAKVVLLEKNANPGGTTAMGGGLFGAYSSLMKEHGEDPVDTDALFNDWMKEMVWKADANLVHNYLETSYTTVDWLIAHGFELHKVDAIQQTHDTYHGYHKYNDFTKTTEIFKNMLSGIEKLGAQIFYETAAKSLITDNTGAITGVIATKKDGTTLEITAKSVVIATGGFVGDEAWVARTFDGVTVTAAGNNSNVGEGIKMAWEVGAAHRGENVHLAHVTKIAGDLSAYPKSSWLVNTSLAYLPINPWINSTGARFANEDIIYDRAFTTNALISQGNYIFTVLSQSMIDTLEKSGAAALGMQDKVAMGPMTEVTPMKAPWTELNAMVNELVKQGVAFKADSYEELAKQSDMDVEKFVSNMEIYNADAKSGKDTLFNKRKQHMVALGDGPYYAIKVIPTNLCTLGGIRINEHLQVVNNDANKYTPIPNLYAAGADAGGLYSDHYVLLEGGAQGWAYNSGRMAGASAASNALKKEVKLQ